MNDLWDNHVFAVTAYKESPYLQDCLSSLAAQTLRSKIIITTSTPSSSIEALASEFDVPLFVNGNKPGIGSDWNFALKSANAPFVTIAHQDDIYCPDYAEHARKMLTTSDKPLLFFTNYGELRNDIKVDSNELLDTKRKMLKPLESGSHSSSVFIRRRILSLGSAICCPSVTFALENLPNPVFNTKFKCDLDWEAWARIAKLDGTFLYDCNILMYHRIHEDSETTAIIENDGRSLEDLEMYKEFWPSFIARCLNHMYARSQKSNQVSKSN